MSEREGTQALDERYAEGLRELMENHIAFNRHLGMRVTRLERGFARMEVPQRPEFVGDPFRPALHGGVISALIDTCGGLAVLTAVRPMDRVSTVDMRVDYLRPGRMEPIVAEARVVRIGNRVGVVTARAFHPGAEDEPIADGKAVYNVRREPSAGTAHAAMDGTKPVL